MSTLLYLVTDARENYNLIFDQPIFVEMWGGKGGHPDITKSARSGYLSFWVDASPTNRKECSLRCGQAGAQGFVSAGGNLGGQAGGPLAFCGGGATVMSITALDGTNFSRQVAIAAGSGGASKDGNAGGHGGRPGGNGESDLRVIGRAAQINAHGANAQVIRDGWTWTNTPAFLTGGNASRYPNALGLDTLIPGGGGGGAGYYSGGGGSTWRDSGNYIHGGGGGGSNYLDTSVVELGIIPCENRVSTLGLGLTTTHPLYHSSGFKRGHDGCVRFTAGVPPAPLSFTTFSNDTADIALFGEPIFLVGEATYGGQKYPIVWRWDGVEQVGADFEPVRASGNLAVGSHTATARVTNATGGTQEIAKSVQIFDVSLTLISPTTEITTAGSPIIILGQLVVSNATLTSFTSKLGTNAPVPQSLGIGGSFSYSFNAPAANTSVVFEAKVNGRIFTTSVDVVINIDNSPQIAIYKPAEFSEWSHDQDIQFSAFLFHPNGAYITQGELFYDLNDGFGQRRTPGISYLLQPGYSDFKLNPQQIGLSLSSGSQQQIDFYLYDREDPLTAENGHYGYRPFVFYTYRGSIQFVGLSTNYSVDNTTQITVDTVVQANYDGQDYTTPFNIAKGFTKLYLDDSTEPFGFSGQGVLPIPTVGPHTITAILLKTDVLGNPAFGNTVFAKSVHNFTVTSTQAPRTALTQVALTRSIIESYTASATSVDYTETVDLSEGQQWKVNGTSIGTGPSQLLDNLNPGTNDVEYFVTDPATMLSSSRFFQVFANSVADSCFAADNIVQLLDGRQVKMCELQPGMMLMDYLDRPVAITGLKKMRNQSRHFIEIHVPGFKHSLLLTKDHPILYQNARVEVGLVAGQPGVAACELREPSDLYHIETENRTFVQIQGACVETVGRHDYTHI